MAEKGNQKPQFYARSPHVDFELGEASVVIEEVNSSEIPVNELEQFQTTEPIQVETLLTRFVNGEISFPDIYSKDDDDDEELRISDSDSNDEGDRMNFQDELFQSRREALRGNLCGVQKQQASTSKESKRVFRRKPSLPVHLQGLMGEANLQFVRGQNEMAEKICLEIIRQNPLAPEPFLTLAQIYESKDMEKYLQFSTIAAHLEKTDKDQWIRVAELYVERKDLKRAKCLYSKAIKYIPKDFDLRLRRAQLYEQMNEERFAMYSYLDMLPTVPTAFAEFGLNVAKKVATFFHSNGKKVHALTAMRTAYNLASKLFSVEDVNMYLELLIMNETYAPVLSTLRDTASLEIELEQEGEDVVVLSCVIPDNMIPEFRSKLCVSLVHLKAVHIFQYLINNVLAFIPVQNNGIDMFMDIVEALMKEEKFSEALSILSPLLERMNERNDDPQPYVWLRHADCHRALDQTEFAIKSYRNVVTLAPNCFDARVTLAALLKKQGRIHEAIQALEQDSETESLVPRLLYERCLLFKDVGNLNEHLNLGYLVILRHSLRLRTREEVLSVLRVKVNYRRQYILLCRESRMEEPEDEKLQFLNTEEILTVDEEYEFLKDLLNVAYRLRRFGMAQKLTFAALISTAFKPKFKEVETLLIYASIFNNDPTCAFNVLRDKIAKNPGHSQYWNLFNIIAQQGDEMRYRRFITRLLHATGNRSQLLTLMANYYLSSQSYKYALSGYVAIFKTTNDPLIALLLAISFSQLSVQKNCMKRSTVVTHAIGFLRKYKDFRMCTETLREVYYNIGRLYQQLRVNHLAIHYYELVLSTPLSDIENNYPERLDLTSEAAFNLHLIYMASGNPNMARKVLYDHITI